jgi:hypothetical protein
MADVKALQRKHFNELYSAFYAFYQGELLKNPEPHEKVRMQLTTHFFDDLELLKLVRPVFESGVSNLEEKRAAARAAYFDALTIHNRTAGLKWESVAEKDLQKGNF